MNFIVFIAGKLVFLTFTFLTRLHLTIKGNGLSDVLVVSDEFVTDRRQGVWRRSSAED